ncbi:Mn2+/Fe2+ NRAMP family transporter [Bradyrhizobium sp. CIR48]|nr:Mn2+/Fe2+ NRAMP family transporter [Bradyrhizobium sp. CIR48]
MQVCSFVVHANLALCSKLRTSNQYACTGVMSSGIGPTAARSDEVARRNSRKKPVENQDQDSFLQRLGPGLITGASDDDPSGIGTYSQAGAQLGFGIGWTMLITYPLMAAIQEISGRIGRVTGHGIAGNVCRNFPAPVIWSMTVLLFIANTINVAADLGAMGDALKLLIGGPGTLYVVVFGAVSVIAQIFFNYERYVSILKWLTLVLFAYVIALFLAKVPWGEALKGCSFLSSNGMGPS